ncbi:uncharacterized protein LOC121401548 isoform X2 [Xenopus laevis]|nr:uncharacterized protein LOC121401548 isoform X2 [Xenopus laevis]
MKTFYFFLLLLLLTTMGRGDRVQETLVEEGGSVLLGERSDFDKERMITDLSFGDQWLASYHDGLDFADHYKGRLIFYPENGSFLLRDLTQGDSGNYTYSVHQAINGKRNKTQVLIHLIVREKNSVTVEPRGTSPGHEETLQISSYSARDIMWQLSVCLAVLSLVQPLLCLSSALWRCCQGGQTKFLNGVSFSSISKTSLDLSATFGSSPSSTSQNTAGGGTPLCCTQCMKISGCVSLGCVWLSFLFFCLYTWDLRAMVWVLLTVAIILTSINIAPLVKCFGIPDESGVSLFPYGSLWHSSGEGSCTIRFLGFLSLALVLVFALGLFLGG